jgi:23S rRNA pseudouridine2605 synthase
LQKFLASAGFGSRRACEELIHTGRVAVNGKVVTELGTRVDPATQEIAVDDVVIRREKLVYWWLNKPPGILCTNRDTHGRRTVLDLLPAMNERIFPVGRLDEESTGLLLLTNDGALANLLTHPRYGVPKTYEVLVAGRVTPDVMTKLKKGIWLSDGRVRVHAIERLGLQGEATKLRIVLREGHNREIRRMFARFEHKVMKLERVAIGPIKIRKIPRGACRKASADEVKMLRDMGRRALEHESAGDSEMPNDVAD